MTRSALLPLAFAALLQACALPQAQPGDSADAVRRSRGEPTATYPLPAGGQRLEYASGPFGRSTWMIDVDTAGRVLQSRQVLSEAELMAVQQAAPMDAAALKQWIGTPGERRHGGRQGGEVWSWRYPTNDCLWFQVSVNAAGSAQNGAFAIDPRCDGPTDARN